MKKSKREDGERYQGIMIYPAASGGHYVDFNRDGKRVRRIFDTLAEARTWILAKVAEVKNTGRAAFSLTAHDRMDVSDFRKLNPSLRLAVVFDYWTKCHPSADPVTLEALVEDFLDGTGRRGKKIVQRRVATVEGHRKRLKSFLEVFGARHAHQVTGQDVETWLDQRAGGELNRRHYLATVRALFNHALRRGSVATNPAEGIQLPDIHAAPPPIMTPAEVEKYLTAMRSTCPELLPREAIAFFAGLRPEELSRLDWRHVSMPNRLITVEAEVAKVQGHRRHVEISDNLAAWLASYALEAGPVWKYASPTTLHRKREKAREAAGVTVPDNAGRHAFASYHLAMHENAPKTAEALGHADVDLLKNVYRNITGSDGRPITKAAAEAYFNIKPKAEPGIVPIRAAAG